MHPEVPLLILVADDERINLLFMRHLLARSGHELVHASNGEETIAALRGRAVGLILMDVSMPVLDGIEATRRIRAGEAGSEHTEVPIVMMTAYVDAEEHERFIAAGADAVLTKPVDRIVLTRLVEEYSTGGRRSR